MQLTHRFEGGKEMDPRTINNSSQSTNVDGIASKTEDMRYSLFIKL